MKDLLFCVLLVIFAIYEHIRNFIVKYIISPVARPFIILYNWFMDWLNKMFTKLFGDFR